MQLVAQRDPGIASLRRRAAAGAIDAALGLVALIGVAGLGAVALERFGHDLEWWVDGGFGLSRMRRWEPLLAGASAGLAAGARNWRSPGMRLLGIRRVDARTRGRVSVHSAAIAIALDTFTARVGRATDQPALERYRTRRAAAAEELERIRERSRGGDREEISEAFMDVYRRHHVGCGPLAWRLSARAAAVRLPALWSRRRQTLNERLARTVVIDDH